MGRVRDFLTRHSLVAGIVLMYLLTWPIGLAIAGVLPFQVPFAVNLLQGYGLTIAALAMEGLTAGRRGVITLLRRFLIWRVRWVWYAVALFLIPAIYVLAVGVNALLTGKPVDFSSVYATNIFGSAAPLLLFVVPFFIVDLLTNGEEVAWRGYVLPRLQGRYTALLSSLILGVIWGLWHLPRFLAPDNTGSFALLMLEMIPRAVLATWLFNNTSGSLLLAALMHAAANTAGVFLPMANTQTGANQSTLLIATLIEIVVAAAVVLAAGPERLSRARPEPAPRDALVPRL